MEKHSVSTFSDLVKMKTEIKNKRINMLDEDEIWKIDVIKDIVLSRKGLLCMDTLDNDEMEDLLKFVCSSWTTNIVTIKLYYYYTSLK